MKSVAHDDGEPVLRDGPSADGALALTSSPVVPAVDVAADDPAYAPASPPRVDPAPRSIEIEHCLLAFGNALQASHERNGRDVLHTLLTAQQEHHDRMMQALADQRLDHHAQLERSIHGFGEEMGRAAARLSDELNPEAILQIGELFHESAGQITGALARTERLTGNMIEKQNRLIEGLGILTGQLTRLLTVVTEIRDHGQALVTSSAPPAPPRASPVREPERHLSLVAGHPDVIADIRDELDDDDDT